MVVFTPQEYVDYWQNESKKYPYNSGNLALCGSINVFSREIVDERKYRVDPEYKKQINENAVRRSGEFFVALVKYWYEDWYLKIKPKPDEGEDKDESPHPDPDPNEVNKFKFHGFDAWPTKFLDYGLKVAKSNGK